MPEKKKHTPVRDAHREAVKRHLKKMGRNDPKAVEAHVAVKPTVESVLEACSKVKRTATELKRRARLENKRKILEDEAPTNVTGDGDPNTPPLAYAPDLLFNNRRKKLLKRFSNMWINWKPMDSNEK